MSLIGSIAGSSSAVSIPSQPSQDRQSANDASATTDDSQSSSASASGNTAAPAESTQTASQVPAVTSARATNASADARPGADGSATDASQRLESAFATDISEAQARREAEGLQQDLMQREVLSLIEVPSDAVPKLADAVETVRSFAPEPEPEAQAAA
ncbi:hypothetical protein N9W17_02270 [Jannaschia sp.]|nr:hypothetical protein [Jannaschia sp.]